MQCFKQIPRQVMGEDYVIHINKTSINNIFQKKTLSYEYIFKKDPSIVKMNKGNL